MINSISYYKDVTNNKMQSLSVCKDFEYSEHCRKDYRFRFFCNVAIIRTYIIKESSLLFKLCLNFYLHFSFKVLVVKIFLWNKKIN